MITKEEILQIINNLDIDVDISSLDVSLPLKEQGLDSLDMATILFEIEDRYGIIVTEDDIESGKLESIEKILSFINEIP